MPLGDGEEETRLDLVVGERSLDHGIGRALTDLSRLGVFPSETGVDLLVLAPHVHAADTRVSRDSESQDGWTRELRIIVPVAEPDRWQAAAPIFVQLLNFLTSDYWSLGFRARPRRFANVAPTPPARPIAAPFDDLALFSGGLDSLIGAIDAVEGGRTAKMSETSTISGVVFHSKAHVCSAKGSFPLQNATGNNLKNVNVDVPMGVLTVVTGVAGSGKISLISGAIPILRFSIRSKQFVRLNTSLERYIKQVAAR